MVFDHDWFAVPFVMMTCQVQNSRNSLLVWFGLVWSAIWFGLVLGYCARYKYVLKILSLYIFNLLLKGFT